MRVGHDPRVRPACRCVRSPRHTSTARHDRAGRLRERSSSSRTVQAPWAVQDASGVIEEIHFSNVDRGRLQRLLAEGEAPAPGEHMLDSLPQSILVRLDQSSVELLPPVACLQHSQSGACKSCQYCKFFNGRVLIKPTKAISQINCLVAEERDRVKNRNTQIIDGERSESRCIRAAAHHIAARHPLPEHVECID